MSQKVVVGTRGSQLALVQTGLVVAQLQQASDLEVVTRILSTEGDRKQDLSLRRTTGQGIFVREIERALLQGEIDFAVHSLKDLPIEETPGLEMVAFLEREDPREGFLSARYDNFKELPAGATIGTSSMRRLVQLQRIKPDCRFLEIRGNIDTRVRKLEEGKYDAIILAMAGLKRLNITKHLQQIFTAAECLPAVGQGVIAIQSRQGWANPKILAVLQKINDQPTEMAVAAERSFLKRLGGGCRLPVGALATVAGDALWLFGMVSNTSGEQLIYHQMAGLRVNPCTLGNKLADWFLEKGIIDWC